MACGETHRPEWSIWRRLTSPVRFDGPGMPITSLWSASGDWLFSNVSHVQRLVDRQPRSVHTRGGVWNAVPVYYAIRYGGNRDIVIFLGSKMGRTQMQNWHGDKLGNITLLQVASPGGNTESV